MFAVSFKLYSHLLMLVSRSNTCVPALSRSPDLIAPHISSTSLLSSSRVSIAFFYTCSVYSTGCTFVTDLLKSYLLVAVAEGSSCGLDDFPKSYFLLDNLGLEVDLSSTCYVSYSVVVELLVVFGSSFLSLAFLNLIFRPDNIFFMIFFFGFFLKKVDQFPI
jgi:hypothetical protein